KGRYRPFRRSVIVPKIDPPARPHALSRPGDVLLSHALRRSTIGAEDLHGRVRNGIGCYLLAITTRPTQRVGRQAAGFSRPPLSGRPVLIMQFYRSAASRLSLRTTPQSSQSSD